ncbi:MAG: diguanylate cyclase [Frankiales bacterium]|nr:diguanylate cyclase [Frankiales bacterium]
MGTPVELTYRDEVRARAMTSAVLIGITALVVVPAWAVFDHLLEPSFATAFLRLRLLCDLPLLLGLVMLRHRWGQQRPELFALGMLSVVQIEIAWMVVRASDAREFYLLGFSLALFASGCVMAGPARWTQALVGVTWAALGVCAVTAPHQMSRQDLAACGFYLGTASVIAVIAHAQRSRLTARELATRGRLEQEQARNAELLYQLQRQNYEDSLTGLANRRAWDAELEAACSAADTDGTAVAVVLIDVDRFKQINDLHGHASGDEALRTVAALVTQCVGARGKVARIGGDELAVLLPEMSAGAAFDVAERIREGAVSATTALSGRVRLSLSLGVASASGAAAVPGDLMARADHELYRAKATRNAVSVSSQGSDVSSLPTQRPPSERAVRT